MSTQLSVDDINLSDIEFWERPIAEREAAFATLRRERPLPFFDEPEIEGAAFEPGPGYYAVTKHADILEASRQPEIFCSGRGATNIADMPEEFLDFFGSMINMDDPRHARLRRIVSRGFTPRMLQKLEGDVQRAADQIIESVKKEGECDFVTEVAAKLPLKIICDMMGIPPSQYEFVFDRSNIILGAGDPEYVPQDDVNGIVAAILTAGQELSLMVQELGRERIANPTDDVTTALVTAEVDGETLSEQELGSFFILLVVAGNETTRNAIAHAMLALHENPDQRKLWAEDFEGIAPTAVEEIVRWASPVVWMRRTATQDATLGGKPVKEGDKFLLFYNSANRDEDVFDDPFRFDLRRDPNPHVGFGGPGPHFCLGAHLARREITVMFRELFKHVSTLEVTGEPDRLRSSFINGIKHLPVKVG